MNYELRKNFFDRSSIVVARELLGCVLCRKLNLTSSRLRGTSKIQKFKIIETEGYEGFKDKASHASRGKTVRNSPMFEKSGTIYVYFTYGMHYMLNIVCGAKGHPSAVLIRGLSTSPPTPLLAKERGAEQKINLSGPARLTKYLKIDKKLNNKKLGRKTGLWIEDNPTSLKLRGSKQILKTPRIGVDSAGPIWSKKLWRFVLKEN